MRAFIALALVAFAVATVPRHSHSRIPNPEWLNEIVRSDERRIEESSFRADREYRYVYNGQLATGIPQSSRQHAATRVQAVVSIVFKTETQVQLKLTHIRMAKMNRDIPNPREMLPFEAFEEAQIVEELEKQLQLPVQFKYNNGLISEIVFDGEEQPWSANLKRGVMNMLQVNLKQHGRTDLSEEQRLLNGAQEPATLQDDFFTCQERTLEGDCETYYTITQQPSNKWNTKEQVMNVTKTINFEKCRQRPDIRYNKRFGEQCNTCDRKFASEEKTTESSTVARYNISGTPEQFLIESAVVESQYHFTPINEQMNIISTYVNQTLELVKAGPIVTRVEELTNPKQSDSQMVYTPEWDIEKERFFMDGDNAEFLSKTPFGEVKNKVEMVEQILRRLVRSMSDEQQGIEEEAPRQMARLVKVLRMCTEQEIEKIHHDFFEHSEKIEVENQQKVKDILVDAMTLAATKNTIKHFVEKTKERKIHPVKAAVALKALVNTRVVSEKQIEIVMELCKHQVSQRSPILRQSCYLTVGSMINALCADNEDRLAHEFKTNAQKFCPLSLKQKYVKELIEMFTQSQTQYEKVLTLKTLANAGLDLSVFELEKIVKNTGLNAPHQTIVRAQAIDALRQLRSVMPRKIQKILMPVYKNQQELPELRMSAVAQIMQTQPERAVLDQLAQQLTVERSQQVVSFVYTLLRTFANSTNPCEKRVAEDLQLALRHARTMPISRILGKSSFIHMPVYSHKYNLGASLNLGAILSNDSYLPKELMAGIDTAFAGQWLKNALQFGMVQQNAEKLIEKLLGHQGLLVENTLEQLLTRGQRQSSSQESEERDQEQPKSILRNLFKKLGVTSRRQQNEEATAMLYMRYRDQDYAFLPLDAETMPESIRQLFQNKRFNVQSIERFLAQGYHMNFHMGSFAFETSRKIPTSLGLPIEIKASMPTVASVTGQVKLQMEPKDQIKRVKLHLNIRPTIATSKIVRVEAWTPVFNTGLKIVESVQMNLPIDTEIEIDTEKENTELKVVVKTPKQMTRIVSMQSRPVTYTRVWTKPMRTYPEAEEKTVQGEEWDRVNNIDKEFGENALGLRMRVQGQWHRTPAKALAGTPCGPFAGNNHVQFYVAPGHEAPEAFVIKADASLFNNAEETEVVPEMDKFYETEEEQRFFKSENDQEPKRRFDKFDQYAKSFRAQNPTQHQLNIKVETRGSSVQRKAQLALKSQCSEEMRFCKWQLEVVRSAIPAGRYQESQPWAFQAKGQTLYPQMPQSLKQLEEMSEENQECTTKIEAEWGPQNRKDQFVYVKIQAKRSEQQIQLQRRSLYQQVYDEQRDQTDVFSPVQQYDELLKAAVLTQYKVQAEYNVNAAVRNITNKVFHLLKHYQLWNTDVAQVDIRNPEGRIHALLTIDPRNLQYVNITMRLPHENVTVTDMSLPFSVQPLNLCRGQSPIRSLDHFVKAVTGRFVQNKCVVSSERVQTFDEVKYRAPLTTCYSVLAKDCSGNDEQPKFAVLMKKISQESQGKKVKIISQENVIELEAKQERYESESETPVRVIINGKQIELEETQTLRAHGVEKQGQYVKVDLAEVGVQVYFDGFAATIKMSPLYRNAQCGLCGHFDGEQNDEFRTADNELTTDVEKFHRSFFHQDEECKIEERIVDDEQQYEYEPFVWEHRDEQEQYRRNQEDREDEDRKELIKNKFEQRVQRPRQATKVIESAHEICFSTKPVPVCPTTTYPTKFAEEKKVSFACLPRSDPEAHALFRIASTVKIVQTEQLKASFVETVLIPQECRQF